MSDLKKTHFDTAERRIYDPRPMWGGLPATVDPVLLAESGARLVGRVAVRAMTRLRALLASDLGEVEVELAFGRLEGSGLRHMHGRLSAAVSVSCQRCLESMDLVLVAEPDVILQRPDDPEDRLPPEADALACGRMPMPLVELVEDELLLAMPMVPMHALSECSARRYLRAPAIGATLENPLTQQIRRKRDRE